MDFRKELRKQIKKDERFLRLKEAFDNLPEYRLPINDLLEEIKTTHKTRSVRRLNTQSGQFVDKLVEASAQDMSARGRLSEIMMTALRTSRSLKIAVTKLEEYFANKYSQKLKQVASTKGERDKFLTNIMSEYYTYIEKVETVRECAALIVTDIDKDNYSMRLIVDTLRIRHQPESQL